MVLARGLAPVGGVGGGDDRVALWIERDFGQFDAVGQRQEQAIDFGAADHHHLRRVGEAQRLRGAVRGLGMLVLPFGVRSEEHTSELQSLMRISYAVFCLKKKKQ